ncbi:uncharacterized protein BDV14DRAFT_137257 [Aspergillus stella-maris]|uniref:uncharacterized protein n=1 Tax=Aspergillus stella-maris TaxID=1810926 RepID=UPI003CCD8C08
MTRPTGRYQAPDSAPRSSTIRRFRKQVQLYYALSFPRKQILFIILTSLVYTMR